MRLSVGDPVEVRRPVLELAPILYESVPMTEEVVQVQYEWVPATITEVCDYGKICVAFADGTRGFAHQGNYRSAK